MLGLLPEQMRVHLDRGYDSETTREKLRSRGFIPAISEKGKPALLQTGKVGWCNAPTRGTTSTRSWCGAPNAGGGPSTSG
jgi:IS5 family transposase